MRLGPSVGRRPHWYRFDLNLDSNPDFIVYHDLTFGGGTNPGKFKPILEGKTNALLATENRIRTGVPTSTGASASADQTTGGASYIFLRIRKDRRASGLYFDRRLMKDADAVWYNGDKYGQVDPDFMRETREHLASSPGAAKLRTKTRGYGGDKTAATIVRNTSNEFLIKDSLDMLKYLDEFVVNNKSERDQIIKAFKDNGITELRGRPIETYIRSLSAW